MFPRPALALLLSALAVPASASAEDSLRDPDGGSLASRIGDWLDRQPRHLQQQLAGAGVFPIASGFAQGTGPAPGLTVFQPRLAGSPLDLMVAGARSFHGDAFQEIRLGRLPHAPGRAPTRRDSLESLAPAFAAGAAERGFVYAELRHRDLDGGLVFDDQGGATPYRLDDTALDLVAGHRLGDRWLVALRAGTLSGAARVDASTSGSMTSSLAAGSGARERFFHTTASFAYDHRDHPRLTARGSFLELSLGRFLGRGGLGSFSRLALDARRFHSLGSEARVLALRATATLDSGSGSGEPFYLLETLGGDRLRGYDPYRFRGPRVASFSAEYRQALNRHLQAVTFWDAGRAWGGAPAMGTNGLRASYGLGLRLLSSEGVLLRVEGARGAEGQRLSVRLGFAF